MLSRRLLAVLLVVAAAIGVLAATLGRGDPAGPVAGPAPVPGREPTVIAYVPYWDQQRGFASVRRNIERIDEVSPFWYSLDRQGAVVLADDENTTIDRATVRFLRDRGIKVLPTVTNLRNGDWVPDLVSGMLADPAAVDRHVRALTDLAVREGYDGIDLDYEDLRAADREPYVAFLRRLATALHAEGKLLATSVHPKSDDAGDDERNVAQDYRAIGQIVDQVRVMTYDYAWDTSPPGPVAPARWVEEVIAWTVTQVPADKVVLGSVLLGYDWVDGRGTTMDHERAMALAERHGAQIRRQPDKAPWFRYTDDAGREHEVHWEDGPSVEVKLRLVAEYGLGGTFFWSLGREDPAVWSALPLD